MIELVATYFEAPIFLAVLTTFSSITIACIDQSDGRTLVPSDTVLITSLQQQSHKTTGLLANKNKRGKEEEEEEEEEEG